MKQSINIFAFTLAVTLFYNYVGQLVPQKEVHPPKSATISADMLTEEMVEAGKIIVEGKGTCLNCHNGSQRFPLLEGIGARAGNMREGYSDIEYLAEALYEPNAFIVEPFAPGMPAVHKPPIGLSDQEVLTVIAYLQSLGGEPNCTMDTKLKYQGQAGVNTTPETSSEPAEAAEALSGEALAAKYGCLACHSITSPDRMVGPSLYDIGKRMNSGELYEALLEPDKTIAEGFPPGVMTATLGANGFYKDLSPEQLKTLVEYLAALKGS